MIELPIQEDNKELYGKAINLQNLTGGKNEV